MPYDKFMRRRKPSKGRKGRKVARRRRAGKKLNQATVYKYLATPNQQYIVNANLAGVAYAEVRPTTGAPIIQANLTGLVPSATGFPAYYDLGVGIPFTLADLKNYSAFTGLYDQWRLDKVTCDVEYLCNSAAVNGLGILPTIYAICDKDDADAPTSLQQMTGRQGAKKFTFTSSKTKYRITCYPKQSALVYNNTNTALYGYGQTTGWNDCKWPDNQHYAIKLWISDMDSPPTGTAVQNGFRITWKYHLSFRGALNEF